MGIIQIEHLKDGIVGGLVLAFDDGIVHAALLDGHVVLKHSLAVQTDTGIAGAGHGDLHIGIGLHILVDIFLVVGAEPQLAVLLKAEHEGAALGLSVTAHSGQILNRVGGQKFNDFFNESTSNVFYSLTCALLAFRIMAKVSTVK